MGSKPNLPTGNWPLGPVQPVKKGYNDWILSYRVQGLAIGLAAAGFYCYFILGYWSKFLLVACGIFGYLIGNVVGYFLHRNK